MAMECRGCGNKAAARVRTVYKFEGIEETCDGCKPKYYAQALVPDVYYGYGSGEHKEENIAYPNGHPKAGEPIPFSSRQGKAEAMKIAGVREAGDRKHGARNESHLNRKIYG